MKDNQNSSGFSVFGGPFSKAGIHLGLIKDRTNSTRLGIAIGFGAWIIIFILSLSEGTLSNFFSLNLLAGHIRLLVAVPLFFICETVVAPRMAEFVEYMVESGLVTESEQPKLSSTIQRIKKAKDSWIPESILFLLVFVLPFFSTVGIIPGNSASYEYIIQKAGGHLTFANGFYLWFFLPLFRFLIVRWLWHLCLWWYFLYATNKLNLNLIPTHSDGAAGLGYLEVVQEYFTLLAMAFSAILSASAAEEIITGSQPFESLYYLIPFALVLSLLFFVGPLFIFFIKLKHCRDKGLRDYMTMSSHYVDAFDNRWIKDKKVTGEEQLGAADLQSLADLTNSVNVIQNMRMVPVSRKLIMTFAVSVILPFLPFVFMKFNLKELLVMMLKLIGGA
jgi:hypothetical protein